MKQYDKIFIPVRVGKFGVYNNGSFETRAEEQLNVIVLTKEELTKIIVDALFESKDITVEEFFENLNNKR